MADPFTDKYFLKWKATQETSGRQFVVIETTEKIVSGGDIAKALKILTKVIQKTEMKSLMWRPDSPPPPTSPLSTWVNKGDRVRCVFVIFDNITISVIINIIFLSNIFIIVIIDESFLFITNVVGFRNIFIRVIIGRVLFFITNIIFSTLSSLLGFVSLSILL